MESRKKSILLKSVQEFIKTGRPVSSGRLYEKYDFGIKPAMLRIELGELDDSGYLYQNHPSGGRYPTNKAYKFFIDYILEKEDLTSAVPQKTKKEILNKLRKDKKDLLVRDAANFLHALGLFYDSEDRFFYSGFKKLVDALDIEEKQEFSKIVQDFERIPERLEQGGEWWTQNQSRPCVFVGQSPLTESEHLSVIVQGIDAENKKLFVVMGPRRMDYRKSLGLFQIFRKL